MASSRTCLNFASTPYEAALCSVMPVAGRILAVKFTGNNVVPR